MIEHTYEEREEKKVLFLREVGDYATAPRRAFEKLNRYTNNNKLKAMCFYGMSLDDPSVTAAEECRFDACVEVEGKGSGSIGEKTFPKGTYAIFTHKGLPNKLGKTFKKIYQEWLPQSGKKIGDFPAFCEFGLFKTLTTKIYVLLEE